MLGQGRAGGTRGRGSAQAQVINSCPVHQEIMFEIETGLKVTELKVCEETPALRQLLCSGSEGKAEVKCYHCGLTESQK